MITVSKRSRKISTLSLSISYLIWISISFFFKNGNCGNTSVKKHFVVSNDWEGNQFQWYTRTKKKFFFLIVNIAYDNNNNNNSSSSADINTGNTIITSFLESNFIFRCMKNISHFQGFYSFLWISVNKCFVYFFRSFKYLLLEFLNHIIVVMINKMARIIIPAIMMIILRSH